MYLGVRGNEKKRCRYEGGKWKWEWNKNERNRGNPGSLTSESRSGESPRSLRLPFLLSFPSSIGVSYVIGCDLAALKRSINLKLEFPTQRRYIYVCIEHKMP